MTKPLSPATAAVLAAYYSEIPMTGSNRLAAALRAVTNQVVPPALEEEFYDRNQALPLTSMVQIRQKFLVIADELDGVKYGTYRCNLKGK